MNETHQQPSCHFSCFQVKVDHAARTVAVSGELDMATVPSMVRAASLLLNDGSACLTIDLAAVTFIDAGAFGALVGLRNEQSRRQASLKVIGNARVESVAALCGLSCLARPTAHDVSGL